MFVTVWIWISESVLHLCSFIEPLFLKKKLTIIKSAVKNVLESMFKSWRSG